MSGRREKSAAPRTSPRRIALDALREVERDRAFSNRALSRRLEREPELAPRDRGFATTLVYGILRHRGRLDALVDACADRPRAIGPDVRLLLRLCAFELRELGHPPHAVGAEASRLAAHLEGSRRGSGGLRGLVTAIVGELHRRGEQLDSSLATGSPLDVLERRWSIPRWWAGRWLASMGLEAALARAAALATTPDLELRVDLGRISLDAAIDRLRTDHPGSTVAAIPAVPGAVRIHGGSDVFHGPLHDEGLVSVQSAAAQVPARLLAPLPGERVLDACAGMGTKTLQLAELMERRGSIVAADVDEARLRRVADVRQRGALGDLDLDVRALDLTALPVDPNARPGPFDAVLLDAPCTGLGTVARHPEIRWHRTFSDLAARRELQRRLLEACCGLVAPEGRLVYSVCSLELEEGPDVVAIAPDLGFEVVATRTLQPEDGFADGFFAARLQRRA